MKFKYIWILLLIALISSCSPLRHYNKVAKDTYPRSKAKRDLMAVPCANEFPVVPKTDTVTTTEYKPDTTNENRLKLIIRQLAKQLENRPECPQIDVDSLHAAIAASIKPDTIYRTKKITNTVPDSALLHVAQTKYELLLKQHNDSTQLLQGVRSKLNTLEENVTSNKWLLRQFLKLNWWWMLLLSLAITAIIILLKKARFI